VALTDEAIEKIKAMIVSGTLRAGDRLPREADLAAELGLSRSSLREAVKALSLVNILDVRRGDGTYVTSLQPPLLLEALSFIVDFHRDGTVLEFLEVRRILEPEAAAMAAERISATEVADLRALLDSLGPDPEVEDLVANDLEFHGRITACSGNSVLTSLLDSLSGPTSRARVWRGLTQAGATQRDARRAPGHPGRAGIPRSGGGPVVVHRAHRQRPAVAGVSLVTLSPPRPRAPPVGRHRRSWARQIDRMSVHYQRFPGRCGQPSSNRDVSELP
jgi:GntR family transcriptional regulator, transcriptional repressor for pyruvate dehydrogenase complex